jgi:predicted aspartyl protease
MLLSFCVVVAHAATPDEDVAAILAAHQRAVGAIPASGTITLHNSYSGQGLTGTTDSAWDIASGRFADRYEIAPTSGANGFDGDTAWQTDLSHASTPQGGGDRPALAINDAYRRANLWWRTDRAGAQIEKLGRDAEGEHVRVTPLGGKAFDAWFDADSHQLAAVREVIGFQTYTTRYRDYAEHAGVHVAGTITVDDGSGPDGLQTIRLQQFALEAARPASAYAMPTTLPDDWTIADASGQVTLPFRLLNNHIFIDASVNGKGPFPFLVDTGGHDILTPSTAKALGLRPIGAIEASGAGDKTQTSGYTRIDSLSFGAASLRKQTVLILDFSPKDVEGFVVGGMIGSEVFQRFVVRIDYGASTISFIDPKRYRATDGGSKVPFVFYDHMPQVQGRFADLPGRFNIDTGSRSEVTITQPFVQAHDLGKRFPGIVTVDGWGVGGPSRSHVVRAPSLELGTVSVSDVTAGLATQTKGAFSDANYEGNVGSGFLKRFVTTFDYAHRTMVLKTIANPGPDVGTFDRSGMWINLADGGFAVVEVAAGGAAAQAGVAIGDVITTLDGKPVSEFALADARRMLRSKPAGTRVVLGIRRAAVTRENTLVLRDQIPEHATSTAR